MWEMVKTLAFATNPTIAKEMFRKDGGESLETINENFERDIKAIDPYFDMDNFKDIAEGLENES